MSLKLDFSNINEYPITKEEILNKISEVDIVEYYLNIKLKYNTVICSPFREDKNPSFSFKINNDLSVLARDWGTGDNYDAFSIVQQLYNCNFTECLNIISSDFGIRREGIPFDKKLLLNNPDELKTKYLIDKQKSIITIEPQAFTKTDIDYWSRYHISLKTLVKFDVFSCKFVWYNGNLLRTYSKINPVYAYKFTKFKQYSYKVYSPLTDNKKYKWLFNGSKDDLEGFDQLPLIGDILVVTKSLKDVMVLYELGIPAISLQGEVNKFEYDIYVKLAKRFNKLYVLYDNDDTGIRSSNRIVEDFNIKQIFIPKDSNCKDIAEYIECYGIEESKKLMCNLIS